MSLLHTLHLHFDWNIVCWHTAHIYTDAFDSLHKSVNNFLSEEQRGQMCPILSSVCLRVLVQMLLLFQQSAHLSWLYSSKKITFFSSYLYSLTYFTTGTKASNIKRRQKEMLTKQPRQTTSPLSDTLRRLMDDCLVLPQIVSSPLSSKAGTTTKQSRKYTEGKKTAQTSFFQHVFITIT